jgi:hypothetical protein
MSYNKELAAAKKAVSLAARLCQVKSLSLPLPVSFSFLYFFRKLGLFGF